MAPRKDRDGGIGARRHRIPVCEWIQNRTGLLLCLLHVLSTVFSPQVLESYGIQPDFEKFVNKETPDAKVNNFERLQPILRELNIKFDSYHANQIITEEPGAALRLLQQIKVALDSSSSSNPFRKGSKSSTALLLTTNRLSSKEQYRDMEEKTFTKMLRYKTADPREFKMTNFLRPFEEEAIRQARVAERLNAIDALQREQTLLSKRDSLRLKMAENRAYLQDWEREGRINHAKNQAVRKERERRDLRLELAMREKERRKKGMENLEAAEQVEEGIGSFEESLRRVQDFVDSPVDEELLGRTDNRSPQEFLQSLTGKIPRGDDLRAESEHYMMKVQQKRQEDEVARKERDRRRRRVLVEQMRTQKEMENRKKEEQLNEKLIRQSVQEAKIAEDLHKVLAQKEAMRQARLRREEQYRRMRDQQYQEALVRDAEVYKTKRKEYFVKLEMERSRFEELEEEREAKRRQKHFDTCRKIVEQTVDLVCKVVEYREVAEHATVPNKQWREWMAVFIAGESLFPVEQVTEEEEGKQKVLASKTLPAEDQKQSDIIDGREYFAYLDMEDEWRLQEPVPNAEEEAQEEGKATEDGEMLPVQNQIFGEVVKDLHDTTLEVVAAPAAPADIPLPPHRLSIAGAPFAGSSRQAEKLAAEFDLTVSLSTTKSVLITAVMCKFPYSANLLFVRGHDLLMSCKVWLRALM
eukprot:753638-Hanusia_phi.AAC.1